MDKRTLKPELLAHYKKELTIVPFVEREEYAHLAQPIRLYQETDQRLYVPRFYASRVIGLPDNDKLTTKTFEHCDNLKFVGKLRPNQEAPVKAMMDSLERIGGGVISVGCGVGKCLKIDTPILMYDGTIKMVQDIVVGDQLMGDDSTPRNVLSLARGRETMYDIVPTKGETYTVNESHILTLKCSTNCAYGLKGTLIDMPLKKYLDLPKSYHGPGGALLGVRTGVEFKPTDVPMDPYFIGVWLGDGSSASPQVTSVDKEIIEYLEKFSKSLGMELRQSPSDPITYRIRNVGGYDEDRIPVPNVVTRTLRELNLLKNKHVPNVYKCNSREVRLKILAGLLDTDGSPHHSGYDIIQKRKVLAEDIVFLSRSLGFAAYMKECRKTCTNAPGGPKIGTYYRVGISGSGLDEIPVLILRKKVQPRKQIKDALVTRIKVVKKEVDDYYGFTIDGNHRFLLGDFTITHNTSMSIHCACEKKVKTAVVCHTTAMMKQWQERLQQFCPTARIGVVQQARAQIEDKDFIIISLKTVALRDYPKDTFDSIGLVIWDEIHLMCTNLFSHAFPKLATKYSIGLSATPYRKDRCDSVFQNYIGPVIFMSKRDRDTSVEAHCISLQMDGIETLHNKFGKIMYTPMAVATVNREERSRFLARLVSDLGSQGRSVLVLGEYVQHLKDLIGMINEIGPTKPKRPQQIAFMMAWHKRLGVNSVLRQIPKDVGKIIARHIADPVTVGLYIGEMKNDARKVSEAKDIILGTYKLASVGMDIPALNTLIMASPRKEIEQSVGRILRKQKGEAGFAPLIYDIIDNHGVFSAQARERKKFYKLYGYTIVHSKMLTDGTVLSRRVVKSKEASDPIDCSAPPPSKTRPSPAAAVKKPAKSESESESEDDNKECAFVED